MLTMFKLQVVCFVTLLGFAAADYDPLHTYTPKTKVTDHAAISLDQAVIEKLVGKNSLQAFHDAKRVYVEGGNSRSVAQLQILGLGPDHQLVPATLSHRVYKGTVVYGVGLMTSSVVGTAFDDFNPTAPQLQVLYDSTETHPSDCRVGGLPLTDRVMEGCLTDKGTQTVVVGATPYTYTYNATNGNVSERTIRRFSIDANMRMRAGNQRGEEFYDSFQPFVDYYGDYAYADKLIMAGLNGHAITMNKRSWNFNDLDFDGRAEIVKKGTALLATGMYVMRELEDSIFDCAQKCRPGLDTCNEDRKVASLDEAVAFYVGANEAIDPRGLGNLFYSLPEKECSAMGTCTQGKRGQSRVNREVFQQFNLMQRNLEELKCEEAYKNMGIIFKNMYVALIQGAIRHAWIMDNDPTAGDKQEAEGAILAAAVLPMVHACNADAADTIYEAVRIGGTPNFASVKRAFESVYSCLEISCTDVGGVIDGATGTKYAVGAAPCGGANVFGSSSATMSQLQLSAMVATFIGGALAILM